MRRFQVILETPQKQWLVTFWRKTETEARELYDQFSLSRCRVTLLDGASVIAKNY